MERQLPTSACWVIATAILLAGPGPRGVERGPLGSRAAGQKPVESARNARRSQETHLYLSEVPERDSGGHAFHDGLADPRASTG